MHNTASNLTSTLRTIVYFTVQPLLLVAVLTLWLQFPEEWALIVVIIGVQLTLGALEHYLPARPDWVIRAKQKSVNIAVVTLLLMGSVLVGALYAAILAEPLAQWRAAYNMDVWPKAWPLVLQTFMAFFMSEFIWYWIHRSEHRWHFIWRLSGHGAHHAFKKLNALNSGLNHPLELFFLAVPPAIMELAFGAGLAAVGATILLITQAAIAHTNLDLNTRVIGWLFTTNRYHIRHHSMVLQQSNTNYGCAAIIWDRVFGTFSDGATLEAGTGPTEPTLWQKLWMPLRELEDTTISPG